MLTTEQLEDIGERFASIPAGEVEAAAAWLAEAALARPGEGERRLGAALVLVLDAIAAGADPRLAARVLGDALTETPAPGVPRMPLCDRLDAVVGLAALINHNRTEPR